VLLPDMETAALRVSYLCVHWLPSFHGVSFVPDSSPHFWPWPSTLALAVLPQVLPPPRQSPGREPEGPCHSFIAPLTLPFSFPRSPSPSAILLATSSPSAPLASSLGPRHN
jgi:hypothetical protein